MIATDALLLQSRQSDTAGWKCIYKKPSTSSDYQRSSWNCKHFLQNDPIPKWTAMKETEPEGAKGLQHIRKNDNFRRHLNTRISFIQPLWSLIFHRSPKTFVMGAAARAIIFVFTAIIITILPPRTGPISRWSELRRAEQSDLFLQSIIR